MAYASRASEIRDVEILMRKAVYTVQVHCNLYTMPRAALVTSCASRVHRVLAGVSALTELALADIHRARTRPEQARA